MPGGVGVPGAEQEGVSPGNTAHFMQSASGQGTRMHLQIDAAAPSARTVELVERKGLGHPDTICDALAEELSRSLSRYYLAEFGRVLHHNVDKVLLSAGRARAAFGGGELLEPIRLFFGGRATSGIGPEQVPIAELVAHSARGWFERHLPRVEVNRDVLFHSHIHPGSRDLVQLFERGGTPLSNDTSFGVGHAPLSPLEALVLEAEAHLNSDAFRAAHPEAGTDVKIGAMRRGSDIQLTVARAFVGAALKGASEYLEAKAETARCLERLARERGLSARVSVNVADDPEADRFYITVLGTSAESGDDGQVGRGNRACGLITPHRPMSLEALAGKNPITHAGKLYNVLAREIAEAIVAALPRVKSAQCYVSSEIGRPLADPQLVQVQLETRDAASPLGQAASIEAIVREHLGSIARLSARIVAGTVQLF